METKAFNIERNIERNNARVRLLGQGKQSDRRMSHEIRRELMCVLCCEYLQKSSLPLDTGSSVALDNWPHSGCLRVELAIRPHP